MSEKLATFIQVLNDTNKTAIMGVLVVLGAIFRIKGYLSGAEMVDLWKTTVVSFMSTTAAINIGTVIKDHLSSKLEELKKQGNS